MSLVTFHRRITYFFLIALTACAAPREEEPEIIVTFEPEFTVDLFEQRSDTDGTPEFGLWVESMQVYDCGNYGIVASVDLGAGSIDIRLEEIPFPDTCLGAPAPARGFVPIGALANGVYRFTLSLNPVIISEGSLSVQNGHYELALSREQGIDVQNRVLETLPANYVWGYVNTPSESDQPLADQYLQQLKPLTAEPALPPGFYSYFTVGGTGQYFFHRSIAPQGQHKPFLRRLPASTTDALRNLLQVYRNDPGHPLEIRCFSTQGVL